MISHCGFDLHFSDGVEHLFMCLLAICISSLEICLFLIGLFAYFMLSCTSSLYILNFNPYQIYHLQISFNIKEHTAYVFFWEFDVLVLLLRP